MRSPQAALADTLSCCCAQSARIALRALQTSSGGILEEHGVQTEMGAVTYNPFYYVP